MKQIRCSFISLLFCSLLFGCDEEDIITIPKEPDPNISTQSEYLAVFGDLQAYTVSKTYMKYYDASISWLLNEIENGKSIKAALQVGDVTETNSTDQWNQFRSSTESLSAVVPYYTCTGNHDYTWDKQSKVRDRNSTLINDYAHFDTTDRNIEEYYDRNSLENYVATLEIHGEKIFLLVLEFGPRKEVLQWAKNYVENNHDKRFILMTHKWLTRYGQRLNSESYAELQLSGYSTFNTPEEIWSELVAPNNNIICVLCGHNGFSAKLFSENNNGRKVPQILFNLQYQENGGNGLLQLWEFPAKSDSVKIYAYDTINREVYMADSTFVSFKYKNY